MYVKRLNIEPPWLPYHTGRPMQADLFPSLLCQKAPSEKQYFSGGNGLKGGLYPALLPDEQLRACWGILRFFA